MNPSSEHNMNNQAEYIKLAVKNRCKLTWAEDDDDINILPPEQFLKSPK